MTAPHQLPRKNAETASARTAPPSAEQIIENAVASSLFVMPLPFATSLSFSARAFNGHVTELLRRERKAK